MNNQKEFIMWDRSESGIIPENCVGIVIDASRANQQLFLNNAERLPKSIILLNPYWDNADYKKITDRFNELKYPLIYYLDERYTNPEQQGTVQQLMKVILGIKYVRDNNMKLIIGEPEINNIPYLYDNEEATYSSYQEIWFRIFDIRIYRPFSNQLSTWNRLEEKYGASGKGKIGIVSGIGEKYTVEVSRQSKFNFVWIKAGQRDIAKCKQWAIDHNKRIALFVDQGTSKKTFLELLNKFNQS